MYGVTLRQYLPHSSYYVGVAGPGSRRNISVFLGGTSDFTKYLPTSTNLTLCSKREHSGESVWGYQGACASEADEAEFRLEVSEIFGPWHKKSHRLCCCRSFHLHLPGSCTWFAERTGITSSVLPRLQIRAKTATKKNNPWLWLHKGPCFPRALLKGTQVSPADALTAWGRLFWLGTAGMPGALPVYDFNANEAAEKAPVSHNTVLAMTGGQGRGKTRVPGQPFRRK